MKPTDPFRKSIRNILKESFETIKELFTMKNFSLLQIQVLRIIAQKLGVGNSANEVNQFLMSKTGKEIMRHYREVLIDRYGEDGAGMPHSDDTVDPGFNPANHKENSTLANFIANEIIQRLGK